MHSTPRGGVPKRRNRKRKRRQAASSSSSSSSSSESGSEDEKPANVVAIEKQVPPVQKEPSPDSTATSDSSESSNSSSESEESSEDDEDEEKDEGEDEEMKSPKPTKRKYPSRSPSPRNSDLPMSLPMNPTTKQEKLKDAEMKERFRKYWMSSVAEGFKDELEQLQKVFNICKSFLWQTDRCTGTEYEQTKTCDAD
jgi:ribosome assembly protein 3